MSVTGQAVREINCQGKNSERPAERLDHSEATRTMQKKRKQQTWFDCVHVQ